MKGKICLFNYGPLNNLNFFSKPVSDLKGGLEKRLGKKFPPGISADKFLGEDEDKEERRERNCLLNPLLIPMD